MSKVRAAITGIGSYVPDYILTNEELSRMVDTSDEWIMQRVGIKERHILREEGKASAYMGGQAVLNLLEKTGAKPEEIELVICVTVTPDMQFPATANLISHFAGIENAWSFDLAAACSSFIFGLVTASQFIESGQYKKIILVASDKMSSIVDYTDRTTCALFGDAAAAVLLEPTTEDVGVVDHIFGVDGSAAKYLHLKAGGSLRPSSIETVMNKEHYLYQEGQAVFKVAVSKMADVAVQMMERHNLTPENLAWLIPHQANLRIIDATGRRMGLPAEKVMINIQKYGNTTSATIPLCISDFEKQLKKGDNLILAAFGGGFTWGSLYLKWAYDSK